jgi:predicted naringenin-chalcone synthase
MASISDHLQRTAHIKKVHIYKLGCVRNTQIARYVHAYPHTCCGTHPCEMVNVHIVCNLCFFLTLFLKILFYTFILILLLQILFF